MPYPVAAIRGKTSNVPETYRSKVMALNPVAYWPLWDIKGDIARDISGNGLAGTYYGVTLCQPGIGDGSCSALFD